MIDFTFTEEQELVRANLRRFGEEEVAPRLAGMIKAKEIPRS